MHLRSVSGRSQALHRRRSEKSARDDAADALVLVDDELAPARDEGLALLELEAELGLGRLARRQCCLKLVAVRIDPRLDGTAREDGWLDQRWSSRRDERG
jgi:hypothetical protein